MQRLIIGVRCNATADHWCPLCGPCETHMDNNSARYMARMVGGGHWRVWDRELNQWLGEPFPSYPDQLLRDLNGLSRSLLSHDLPRGEDRPGGWIRVAYLAVAGAVLGGPIAVWLLLPGPPGPGEAGCGNDVLGALLFGPILGALAGGLLGFTAGLLFNVFNSRASMLSIEREERRGEDGDPG
jgi:hypothetical protein